MKLFKLFNLVSVALVLCLVTMAPVMVLADNGEGAPTPEWIFPAAMLSVVGLFAPWAISWLIKNVQGDKWRYFIAMGLSGLMAFIGLLVLKVELSLSNLIIALPAFAKLADTAYRVFWHKLSNRLKI